MKIKSSLLRAAQVCQAKKDARFYLNGIHVKGNKIESTNGHVAVQLTMNKKIRGEFILDIKGKVPARAEISHFEFNGKSSLVKHFDHNGMMIGCSPFESIEGRYPDFERITPKEFDRKENIILNATYMAMAEKIFGSNASVRIRFSDQKAVMTAESLIAKASTGDAVFIVMSIRES